MTTENRPRLGATFVMTLALSWVFVTTVIALCIWRDRTGSLIRLASWISLWVFTVLVPTLNAMTVHRAIADLQRHDENNTVLDSLAPLKPGLLLCANMALLSAIAVMFNR